ncbi:MAG: hypothetical protein OEY52_10675 [Gammaproteobacteria bacterium]|nr:hypothetical protein [Gammaproteobacteria bacterium]
MSDSDNTSDINMLDQGQNAQQLLEQKLSELSLLDKQQSPIEWARVMLDIADAKLALGQNPEAWQDARASFDVFLQHENWQQAVEACNVMYQTEQPASIGALAQGIWLAVTYPIAAETTVTMLHNIIEDTPKNADGAAVAAATAHYIASIRTSGEKQDSLCFLTTHILGQVAKAHSHVENQEAFDMWLARLELDKPEVLLPRMAQIIDAMAGDEWWFDRDELRAKLPTN